MKAYVASVGEPTTDLCVWALERQGFEVELISNNSTLAEKLEYIYHKADDDFLRVDADIIVNRNMTSKFLQELIDNDKKNKTWWWQFLTFDWYKQDTNHAMAFIRKQALPDLRDNIDQFINDIRPETRMSRIEPFYNPRRMSTYKKQIMGIHGYGIKDTKPVIKLKANRGQTHLYDFELARRLDEL